MRAHSLSSSQSGRFALLYQSPYQTAMDLHSCTHFISMKVSVTFIRDKLEQLITYQWIFV